MRVTPLAPPEWEAARGWHPLTPFFIRVITLRGTITPGDAWVRWQKHHVMDCPGAVFLSLEDFYKTKKNGFHRETCIRDS